jgi:hypothetical protein
VKSACTPVSPVPVRRARHEHCGPALPCSIQGGPPFQIVQLAKSSGTSWKGYSVEETFYVASITLIVALPEMIDNLTSETVISVTAKAEIVVSILNQIEYFGDETVTVVECKVFVKKPYETHGESGHGIKAEKAGAGVTLSPIRFTKFKLLTHKPF